MLHRFKELTKKIWKGLAQVTTITMNNPKKYNAWDMTLCTQLAEKVPSKDLQKQIVKNHCYNISLLVPRSCWEQWHKGIVCICWRNIGKTRNSKWWSLILSRWWFTRGLENTTALAAGTLIIWPQFSFWNFKKLSFLILICWPPVCLNSWAARHRGSFKGSSGF